MSKSNYIFFAIFFSQAAGCSPPEEVSGDIGVQTLPLLQPQGVQIQGTQVQGTQVQGTQVQGTQVQGFLLGAVTLGGADLENVRVERGELLAELNGMELSGADLIGAHLIGETELEEQVPFRITDVVPEDPDHDPTGTGHTFLYMLELQDDEEWKPACIPDLEGERMAIPLNGTWNLQGDRSESQDRFTFGCSIGALAKCYRWGYRPWLEWEQDPELLTSVHQACTRLARADYCGDGKAHTEEGNLVNVWDDLDPIIQERNHPGPEWLFEATWKEEGAVCLSPIHWLSLLPELPLTCWLGLRPRPPGFCATPEDALDRHPSSRLFSDRVPWQ